MSYLSSLNILTRHERGQDKLCMAPAVAAALIGGGASLIGSLVSAGSSASQAAAGRAYSNEQIKYLANHDRLMQLYDQIYNDKITDPSYIKAQYEKAGLNPSLMMEGGTPIGSASGNSSASASAPPVADYTQAIQMASQGVAGGVDTYLRAKQVEQDNLLKREQTELLRQQGLNQQIRNQFQTMELQRQLELMQAQLEDYKSHVNVNSKTAEKIDSEIDILDQQQKRLVATYNDDIMTPRIQNESTQAATRYTNAKTATENLLRVPQLRNIVAQTKNYQASSAAMYVGMNEANERINLLKSQGKLTDANVDKVVADTAKTWLEAVGVDNNNKMFPLLEKKVKSEIKRNIVETVRSARMKVGPLEFTNPLTDMQDILNYYDGNE